MKLTMLGTGNALVTECYNTCFILSEGGDNLLVDGGGGSMILHQLMHSGFGVQDIHDVFITHSHIDHILGIIWVIRIAAQLMNKGSYSGDMNIYSHDEVISLLSELVMKLLLPYQAGYMGRRIHLHVVDDQDTRKLTGHEVKFFDIHSARTKQYGFTIGLNNGRLTFCGDEPCHASCEGYVSGSKWLIHEAFCLYGQRETFRPYEKHHSTVRDACELAERSGVKKLILCHTEDVNILRRRELYLEEGRKYFSGDLFIPYDLETLDLT